MDFELHPHQKLIKPEAPLSVALTLKYSSMVNCRRPREPVAASRWSIGFQVRITSVGPKLRQIHLWRLTP